MTHCVEPFIQDIVWEWLNSRDEYQQVGSEITIGTGVNSGRIDLVAKTRDGEYHGFEIKNTAVAGEQLNRYLYSEYLDKLFHCSRRGERMADQVEQQDNTEGTYENQQIRKEVSNAIAAGQYTQEEYRMALREVFPKSVLEASVNVSQTNERILDEAEKTVYARLTQNLGIPTADFRPSETYIELDEAMTRMRNNLLLPEQIGVVDVPFKLDQSDDDEDDFRPDLTHPIDRAFSKEKRQSVEILRDADQITRNQTPTLSSENEAWVQHHVWRVHGCIREAVIPSPEDNAEYLIDAMGFEHGRTPAAIYQQNEDAKLIGIEAKGHAAFNGADQIKEIRAQLARYQESGTITHLYLAVPEQYQDSGEQVLATDSLVDVGLMTVSQTGNVTTKRSAEYAEMAFDSYIKISGTHEYTRSIGFGTLRPQEEPDPVAPCRVE